MKITRVYTCFDACGSKNPAATDLKYYFLLRAWSSRAPLASIFVDVHRASGAAKPADLQLELGNRLRNSDVLLLILSERTAASGGWLSWEIEFGAGHCRLPIVCAYTGSDDVESQVRRRGWWPQALQRVDSRMHVCAMHVPFRPAALASAFRHLVH